MHDPTLLNRLALVKQLYNHAAEHGRSRATVDKIICITGLDHAVEMLLEGVIQAYPTPTRFAGPPSLYFADPARLRQQDFQVERAGFFRLWDQVVAICQEMDEPQSLILKSEMRSLHLARNDAQHSIKVPSSEFLAEMIGATRAFLDHLLNVAFGLSLRQISDALLIRTPTVRGLVEEAQEALAEDDLLLFAGLLRLAFTLAQMGALANVPVGRFLTGQPPGDLLAPALDEISPESGLARGLSRLQDYLAQVHAELTSLSLELGLGLERQAFSRFAVLTPAVPYVEPDGHIHWLEGGPDPAWLREALDADTCLWLQDYAIQTILRWEADGLLGHDVRPPNLDQAREELRRRVAGTRAAAPAG